MARPNADPVDKVHQEYLVKVFHNIPGRRRMVAEFLGISQQAISEWVNITGRIPVEHLAKLSAMSGEPMTSLRPDLSNVLKDWPDDARLLDADFTKCYNANTGD